MSQVQVRMQLHCHDTKSTDDTAEYVKILSTKIPTSASRNHLLYKVCSWIRSEALFHEHSDFVAQSVHEAVARGKLCAVPAHTYAAVVGCDQPQLRIAVDHEMFHENVHLALGLLNISTAMEPGGDATPAYTYSQSKSSMKTNVPALQIKCLSGDLTFSLSLRLFPTRSSSAFSQCFEHVGGVCSVQHEHTKMDSICSSAKAVSHYGFRQATQAIHKDNLIRRGLRTHADVYTERLVLDKTTSVISSTIETDGDPHTVYTVFFR